MRSQFGQISRQRKKTRAGVQRRWVTGTHPESCLVRHSLSKSAGYPLYGFSAIRYRSGSLFVDAGFDWLLVVL